MKNKIVAELKRIANANGGLLKPELVVEKARPKSSPLHDRFEWDNTVAGHQYRIWQARQLIRVTVETVEGIEAPIDVFVSLTPDRVSAEGGRDGGGYRIVTTVLSDAEMREQMLVDALNELRWFKAKYARLKELAEIFAAIDRVKK